MLQKTLITKKQLNRYPKTKRSFNEKLYESFTIKAHKNIGMKFEYSTPARQRQGNIYSNFILLKNKC